MQGVTVLVNLHKPANVWKSEVLRRPLVSLSILFSIRTHTVGTHPWTLSRAGSLEDDRSFPRGSKLVFCRKWYGSDQGVASQLYLTEIPWEEITCLLQRLARTPSSLPPPRFCVWLVNKSTCPFPPTVFHLKQTGYEGQRLRDEGQSICCIILGSDQWAAAPLKEWPMTAKTICFVFIAGERTIFLEIGTEVWYNYNETRCSKKHYHKKETLYGSFSAWYLYTKYKHNHKIMPLNVRHPLYAIML